MDYEGSKKFKRGSGNDDEASIHEVVEAALAALSGVMKILSWNCRGLETLEQFRPFAC